MEEYMWIIWLSLFLLTLIVEALTTDLVSIFFTGGAAVSLVLSFITGIPYWVEIVVFTALSVISLLALRPIMKKYLDRQKRETNVDEFIGKKVKLTKGYQIDSLGETLINDVYWSVKNLVEEEELLKDSIVTVVSIKGNKLIVKK